MKESRELLNDARTAIPEKDQITPDEIQDLLAVRMAKAISEIAADYDKTNDTLSLRGAAVLARVTLEAMFRLLGALHSKEIAAKIIYTSTKEDLNRSRRMKDADPAPTNLADTVTTDLESSLKFIETTLSDVDLKTITSLQIAKKVDCLNHYCSHYFTLSQYVHSSYATLGNTPSDYTPKITDSAFLLACCLSADFIAGHYKHPNAEKIQSRSRALWKEHKQ